MTSQRSATSPASTPTSPDDEIRGYRGNGFIHLKGVLTPTRSSASAPPPRGVHEIAPLDADNPMFRQIVQVWKSDDTLRELTLHPGLADYAAQLAGIEVRLWHDQLLIKKPHNHTATEFHQDSPYWPHTAAGTSCRPGWRWSTCPWSAAA